MTTNDRPWEPPLAGSEVEHLTGALDRLRTTFRWKTDALDTPALQARVSTSALTLAGLLKHLALVEDHTFITKLTGHPLGAPWDTAPWDDDPDWDFTSAAHDTPDQLYALWDTTVQRSRLRRLVCDLIEEYGRHTGHADILRESIDGLTGEDPPPGWRPKQPDHP